MNGSTTTTVVLLLTAPSAGGQFVPGSGNGDDPNRYPFTFNSAHDTDYAVDVDDEEEEDEDEDVPAAKKSAVEGANNLECPICNRTFGTEKGVHGHMRSHYERPWRGMEPPQPPRLLRAADGNLYRYMCPRCGAPFHTRQALGGHRASHSGKKGCFWLAKEEAAAPPFMLPFDLNDPLPEVEAEPEQEPEPEAEQEQEPEAQQEAAEQQQVQQEKDDN